MSVGVTELRVSAGDMGWADLSLAERSIKLEVRAYLLTVHQEPVIFVPLFQAPTDGIKLRSRLFYVASGLAIHMVHHAWTRALAVVSLGRSGRIIPKHEGSVSVRVGCLPLVP